MVNASCNTIKNTPQNGVLLVAFFGNRLVTKDNGIGPLHFFLPHLPWKGLRPMVMVLPSLQTKRNYFACLPSIEQR